MLHESSTRKEKSPPAPRHACPEGITIVTAAMDLPSEWASPQRQGSHYAAGISQLLSLRCPTVALVDSQVKQQVMLEETDVLLTPTLEKQDLSNLAFFHRMRSMRTETWKSEGWKVLPESADYLALVLLKFPLAWPGLRDNKVLVSVYRAKQRFCWDPSVSELGGLPCKELPQFTGKGYNSSIPADQGILRWESSPDIGEEQEWTGLEYITATHMRMTEGPCVALVTENLTASERRLTEPTIADMRLYCTDKVYETSWLAYEQVGTASSSSKTPAGSSRCVEGSHGHAGAGARVSVREYLEDGGLLLGAGYMPDRYFDPCLQTTVR
ncbi:hypothetical protein GUITHDRAFT_101792 [Guillardia theta CCMP2712]|uniref:Uncharacterized protein n=1 Tax=Guillardia theta (strain CCMP2712) TaxID=905079 RepID=L1JVM2_GUITC|nr:hypothetical protein GUITHDRAFT_101792 [Guillardia theta CCMP2712]EKX52631.1 hypothetical protein GUITHDRAFT_101792 [Guillardia theta CCMP2712]|eukprot:XP_005839611.1 hypothetical protein GUITHDRAFT_101792 [Guillardia theta CCMP2712]